MQNVPLEIIGLNALVSMEWYQVQPLRLVVSVHQHHIVMKTVIVQMVGHVSMNIVVQFVLLIKIVSAMNVVIVVHVNQFVVVMMIVETVNYVII